MFLNLAIGTGMMGITVLVHTLGLIWITTAIKWLVLRFRARGAKLLSVVTVVIALFAILLVEIWLWAICYSLVGAFPDFATGLYFSIASFATLGLGDVVPIRQWRILGALESLNGFLLIGWSTAYLISASTKHGPFRSGEHF
jgi:hypothetical protein